VIAVGRQRGYGFLSGFPRPRPSVEAFNYAEFWSQIGVSGVNAAIESSKSSAPASVRQHKPCSTANRVQFMTIGFFTDRRRDKLRSEPLSYEWRRILETNFPAFNWLSREDQDELSGHVQVFLAEKHMEGCGGLVLTDEIRVTIAAQACLLLLHRETDYYPDLTSVLVYPTGYTEQSARHIGGGIWEEGPEDRLGHTARGLRALVLAWDAARHGALNPNDGRNVVLHEFAHQLDFENDTADGTPALDTNAQYASWDRVMGIELHALRHAAANGIPTVLDTYGASNPIEFFAVATEAFFERPHALKAQHPALYSELQKFFRQDPVLFVPLGSAA
jgi:MtfA peptidase